MTTVNLLITANSANTITVITAGGSDNSPICLDNEYLQGVYIDRMWSGAASGQGAVWQIADSTSTIAIVETSNFQDFTGNGAPLKLRVSDQLSFTPIYSDQNSINDCWLFLTLRKVQQ